MALVVRTPAVAGLFYPEDKSQLKKEVAALLTLASSEATNSLSIPDACPKVLVVPHAGYIYSGEVAAKAFALLMPYRNRIKRVLLLGPTHRVPLEGMALPNCDVFRSPMGDVVVDLEASEQLKSATDIQSDSLAHEQEHSLEVQLPFLQSVLDSFTLIPIVVGRCLPASVAKVLESVWGGDETLVVISTDLSHFHNYQDACHLDRLTSNLICQLRGPILGEQACGCYALNGLLHLLKEKQKTLELLELKNSGDTSGARDRVVGYGAYASF